MGDKEEKSMEYPNLSGEHFRQIINFAKLIAGIVIVGVTIITSVAIYFSYGSIQEIKEEVRSSTKELKVEVNKYLEFSQNEIDRINKYSEKQINFIKDDAIYNAQKSAEKEVEQFFKNDIVVKSLVRNTAEQVLGTFEGEVNGLLQELPDILLALDKIQKEERTGIEKIQYLMGNSDNEIVKNISKKVFEEKKEDYFRVFNNINGTYWDREISLFLKKMEEDPSSYLAFSSIRNDGSKYLEQAASSSQWSDKNKNILIDQLISNVKNHGNLNVIALSFFIIKEMTDIDCDLFDFKSFNNESASYKLKQKYLK